MSLADRLATAQPKRSNYGCQTCLWWPTISPESQKLINDWIDAGHSQAQLHAILTAPDQDSDDPPLDVSESGWRFHLKHHEQRCR